MTPRIARSHDIHIDSDYVKWITELKQRYRSAQVKAVIKVNAEKLQFNWLLGRDLVRKKAEERWGSGVVEQLSLDLRRDFPDADGFSVSNKCNSPRSNMSALRHIADKVKFVEQKFFNIINKLDKVVLKMYDLCSF
ncbi:MAG: hypothetical protein J6T54_13000 [Fibrobacter sp.]|nr:hypothetical protein [Fibrobacter sp.]